MLGMGWSEMLLIGVVALIVVGPKDLPGMFRTMGQFTGKARGMAREFSRAMEAAADDSGVRDISKTIRAAANPTAFGTDKLREAAGLRTPAFKPGTETAKLSEERAAQKAKIAERTAAAATARKTAEAEALQPMPDPTPPAADAKAHAQAPAKAGAAGLSAADAKPVAAVKAKAATKPKAAAKPKAKPSPETPAKPSLDPKAAPEPREPRAARKPAATDTLE